MVKFGGHVEAIREGDLIDANLYLIPYNEIKTEIFEAHNEPAVAAMAKKDGLGLAAAMANQQEEASTTSTSTSTSTSKNETEDKNENKNKETETAEDIFVRIWKEALQDAEEDFRSAREDIWQTVFAGIAANDDTADPLVRGAHPGNAIKLYVDLTQSSPQGPQGGSNGGSDSGTGTEAAHDLLVRMIQVYRAASINSEGLRKLVKKSDKKNRKGIQLSSTLLPLLYTSSLYTGQSMVDDGIGLLRHLISGQQQDSNSNDSNGNDINGNNNGNGNNDDDSYHFKPLIKRNSESRHQESIDIRMMEVEWLKSLVRSIPSDELLPKLVAHRGFHHIKDRNDKRPVENSLSAYEMAWTCGIELCECDIALTKDEKLVLAHDENFERLSLDTRAANSKRKVSDLTFKELISMPLTSGVRPPLLIDVLRSASAISERSKLIIEIKPGNEVSAFALARLLIRHPDLRSSVAMIMSFDAATMHRLRAELDRAALLLPNDFNKEGGGGGGNGTTGTGSSNGATPVNTHRRVTSYDHFGTMSSGWLAGIGGGGGSIGGGIGSVGSPNTNNSTSQTRIRNSSIDLSSSIGLSISQGTLGESYFGKSPPATSSSRRKNSIGGGNDENKQQEEMLNEEEEENTISFSPSFGNNAAATARGSFSMPKLMLLTVADPPNMACELQVHYNELHRVDPWLMQDHDHRDGMDDLDGVYLQFEEEMMTPEGAAYLRQLSQRFLVGIWGYAERDPDDFTTFEWLVKEGNCSFVNSDLPKHFRKELLIQNQRLPPRH